MAPLWQDPCIYWPSLNTVSVMKNKMFYNIENPFQWHFHMVHKICRLLFLDKLQNTNKINIVSRFPNETMSFGPQMFIVKSLIIGNTESCQIYIRMERRGKELVAGETERERVCERRRVAENGGSIGCKNGHWRNGPFWVNLGSWCKDYFNVRKYFNGRERLQR